jgi:hypothetical protein
MFDVLSSVVRTTLDIDDDVLNAAKERARRERRTMGAVVSDLLRGALTSIPASHVREPKAVHGLRPFARRGNLVTNELIDDLRSDDAY